MNRQSVLMFIVVCGLHANSAVADELAPGPLTVTVEVPTVPVLRHLPGRYFFSLPTLEYAFEVEAHCSGKATPTSLSINVADSRVALSTAELGADDPQKIELTIPARQIPPIAINDFCLTEKAGARAAEAAGVLGYTSGEMAPKAERTTVSAALSAQVSLLCSSDTGRKIVYITQPLDVTLACAPAAAQDPDPER